MDKAKISERLRALRGDRSISTVAADIGITPAALSNYEQGIRIPRDEIKLKIAKYYKKSVDYIFFS